MLIHLRIKNFKAWRDTGDIRLAPLTVLFGANSAGKSSIPQFLLMLRQTVESPDKQRVLHFGDRNTLTDLGTFEDVLFNHNLEGSLDFELGWTCEPLEIRNPLDEEVVIRTDHLTFSSRISRDNAGQPRLESFDYKIGKWRTIDALEPNPFHAGLIRTQGNRYKLQLSGYKAIRQLGRKWPLPPPYHFHAFPDEAVAYYQNTAFLSDLGLTLQDQLRDVLHVGPLRDYPNRIYAWSGEQHTHVGQCGERAVEALLAAKDRTFNFKERQRLDTLDKLVAKRLHEMGLIHSFEVKPIAQGRKEYEVLIKTSPNLPTVKLTDVGIGVSQVLPVIVECFCSPPGSTVIFEQPEIHLHPKVQADLADLFVDAIRARENGTHRNVQFIIESHSEHFLRRLQRRIAEEKLAPEDAALYFIRPENGEAQIEELDVDLYGNILNWPPSFFGDEMEDLVARAEAQARRMRNGKKPAEAPASG